MKLGKWRIGKECSAKWFPYAGYGYWDGIRMFLRKPMNLKFRTFEEGFAIGPLMVWKSTFEWRVVTQPSSHLIDYAKADVELTEALYRGIYHGKTEA